ncbi:hypothetical protein [Dactylosporangium matsuzakiense]|uniref:hypothetical protein n=1 Tax=Dactylosporangium matsuzakiense TaxID=53360 RepID=UPI0022F2DC8F|nr:hypothetical protein [Dactylosporangium matsuzakiense]
MGIDLELADVAAARYQHAFCLDSGRDCAHDPNCYENLVRLVGLGPSEFLAFRRFTDINETMQRTGMGYEAEPQYYPVPAADPDDEQAQQRRRAADLRDRSQTVPGKSGIPAFKLRSNDRWVVTSREIDEALLAYASVPPEQRASLEADPRWASWLQWLVLARERGGFEAE